MNEADLPDLWVRAADIGYETGNDVPAWLTRGFGPGATRYVPAARLDALRVELDRAFDELGMLGVPKERACTVANGINVLMTRISKSEVAMLSELNATRADAERYRWLRNDSLMYLVSGPICVAADKWGTPIKTHPESDPSLGPAMPVTLDGKELDAAIDAARKERT